MPVRGIIFIAVVALIVAILRRDDIYSWIENEFGINDAEKEEKENEEE